MVKKIAPLTLLAALGCANLPSHEHTTATGRSEPQRVELAGRSLDSFPHFEFIRTFDPSTPLEVAIDAARAAAIGDRSWAGTEVDLYIVRARTKEEWRDDATLVDARPSGPQSITIGDGGLTETRYRVAGAESLPRQEGHRLGVAYDVVVDRDRDGRFGPGDLIDGGGDQPGFFLVHDTTLPGPLEVSFIEHNGGVLLGQRIHYPTAIETLGTVPVVVISHGFTHIAEYYDFIGRHLASYGYVVMAHTNAVGRGNARGTETASTTTITNTDHLLGNVSEIGGGVLAGHLDSHRIVWMGHSTGGECVVRAHTRVRTGDLVPKHFGLEDIVLISSICPVSFLKPELVTPEGVPYHIFSGGADTDTSGAPVPGYFQSFAIFERATGPRQLTYVQNSGHEWFHGKSGGNPLAEGPDLAGRPAVHTVVRGYTLALVELYARGNLAGRDFFTRNFWRFHPVGIDPSLVVANEFDDGERRTGFVIEDFQIAAETNRSSSGGRVSFDVSHLEEIAMIDRDGSFDWTGNQPSNGMTRGMEGEDDPRCVVFDWTVGEERFYELEVIEAERDWRDDAYLSFRVCQGTRHPETVALAGPLTFSVSLRDSKGRSSRIDAGHYGEVTRPYQRKGFGDGAGWQNEFSTFRIRIADFAADGAPLDLEAIAAVRFEFGKGFGAPRGRIGLDDIQISRSEPPGESAIVIRRPRKSPRFAAASAETVIATSIVADTPPERAELWYRFDDGEFRPTAMVPRENGEYAARLPAGAGHAEVEYYFAVPAVGSDREAITQPAHAPGSTFRLPVGDEVIAWSDRLDRDPKWSTTGEWAFGVPEGKGGGKNRGSPDPTAGSTGRNVYGINLAGNYAASTEPQHLIAGPIDLRGFTATTLEFQRWLNCDARRWVHAGVDVSTDAESWTRVWLNGNQNIEDEAWTPCRIDIAAVADNQPRVWVRWQFELQVDDAWAMSGWNIDDVEVRGVRDPR